MNRKRTSLDYSEEEPVESEGIIGLSQKDDEDSDNDDAPVDEAVYNIEALVEKKCSSYLVKWENFQESQNTLEPSSAIPPSILMVKLFLNIKYSVNIPLI